MGGIDRTEKCERGEDGDPSKRRTNKGERGEKRCLSKRGVGNGVHVGKRGRVPIETILQGDGFKREEKGGLRQNKRETE